MGSEFIMFMDGVVGDVMQCISFLVFLPQNVLLLVQIFEGVVNFCSELRFACFISLLNKALFFLNCIMFSRGIFLLSKYHDWFLLVLSCSRDLFHQGTVFFLLNTDGLFL